MDFNDTTLETWKSFIPYEYYDIKTGNKEISILKTVKIQYGGFDSTESIKRFNSAEFAYCFIDQSEEINRDDYGLLCGTFRKKIKDTALDYKLLLTANPANCFLLQEFISGTNPRNAFIKALPADNPFLPGNYVKTLEEAFKHRPELIDAYIHGSWDVIAGFDLVIKPSWVESAAINTKLKNVYEKRVVVCDPARFGADETVIYVFEDHKVVHQEIYGQLDTMQTAGKLGALVNKYSARLVGVDAIGIGAGIVDRLRELRQPVLEINSANKASTEELEKKYSNRRAEMWWEAGELFAEGDLIIPSDETLKRQLCSVKYVTDSRGRFKVESKDDIKKRFGGKSPDRADAFVMGLHTLKHCPIKSGDFGRVMTRKKGRSDYGWDKLGGGLRRGYR